MNERPLRIASRLIQEARSHLESCLPEEGCGLMGGVDFRVARVIPVSNADHRSDRFRMDPREQVDGLVSLEAGGLELLAIYHSHPAGPSGPSATDLNDAAYPEAAYLVFSSPDEGWPVRAFRIVRGKAHEIDIRIDPEGA